MAAAISIIRRIRILRDTYSASIIIYHPVDVSNSNSISSSGLILNNTQRLRSLLLRSYHICISINMHDAYSDIFDSLIMRAYTAAQTSLHDPPILLGQ